MKARWSGQERIDLAASVNDRYQLGESAVDLGFELECSAATVRNLVKEAGGRLRASRGFGTQEKRGGGMTRRDAEVQAARDAGWPTPPARTTRSRSW